MAKRSVLIACGAIVVAALVLALNAPVVSAHIEFYPYDTPTPAFTDDNRLRDPINLAFWDHGDVAVVRGHLIQLGWSNCFGGTKYAFVEDNHAGGHSERWEAPNFQICKGSFFGTRYHIRLYDGYSDPDGFHDWTLGQVHKEVWSWSKLNHVVISWENAESLVRSDFTGRSYTSSIYLSSLDNAGYFGQYDPQPYNDGLATFIGVNS